MLKLYTSVVHKHSEERIYFNLIYASWWHGWFGENEVLRCWFHLTLQSIELRVEILLLMQMMTCMTNAGALLLSKNMISPEFFFRVNRSINKDLCRNCRGLKQNERVKEFRWEQKNLCWKFVSVKTLIFLWLLFVLCFSVIVAVNYTPGI